MPPKVFFNVITDSETIYSENAILNKTGNRAKNTCAATEEKNEYNAQFLISSNS